MPSHRSPASRSRCRSRIRRAATLTWSGTGGSGGTGTWNTSLALWNLGAATWSNAAPDNAVFAGTPGTVTLGTGITAGSVTFNVGGYALNAANNLTASTLAGSGAASWIGTGTLTLSGSSTLTGALTIGGGMVQLNNGASLKDVSGITISGGAGTVGGAGYPFKGVTRGGTLYLRDDAGTGGGNQLTTTGTVTMQNGSILWNSGAGSDFTTISNVRLDSGFNSIAVAPSSNPDVLTITNLTRSAGATVEFRAAYAPLGTGEAQIRATNVNGAPIANTNGILGGWAFVANETTFAEYGGAAKSFAAWNPSATIGSAVGSIVAATPDKANGGSGATTTGQDIATGVSTENWLINTTASGNTITSGTVTINSLIEEQDLRINNGSTLVLQSGGLIFRNNNFWLQTSAGATGFLTSGGNDIFLQTDGGAGVQEVRVIVRDGAAGAVALRKSGPGTVSMNQINTYTGGTEINQGVLNLTTGGQQGGIRGTATINAGGTLRLSAADATGWGGGATALTTITINGGTLDVNTASNQTLGSGTLNLSGGSITGIAGSNIDFLGGGSRLNSLASPVTSVISGVQLSPLRQGNVTFDVAAGTTPSGIDLRIDSVIKPSASGDAAGVLTKSGAGRLLLTATNTFDRGIAIAAGTLELGGAGVLRSGSFAQAISNAGNFVFSSSAAQILSGSISGAGSILKSGAGTLTLVGANTYTGTTTVTTGTLVVAGASGSTAPIGSRAGNAVVIGPGATVVAGAAHQFGWNTANTATITVGSGGTLNTGGFDQYVGSLVLDGSATISAAASYVALRGDLTATPAGGGFPSIGVPLRLRGAAEDPSGFNGGIHTFTVGDDGTSAVDLTIATTVDGAGGLAKAGAGTLLLSASNSWTGGTRLDAGVVEFATNALGSSGTVTMNGGTLRWAGGNTQDVSSRLALAASATATLDTNGNDVSFGSGLGASTSAAVVKTGAGTLTLSGSNGWTGPTTVSQGGLTVASGGSLTGSALTVSGGATLAGAGTLGSTVIANGGILAPGVANSGTLTLASLTFGVTPGDLASVSMPVSVGGALSSGLSVGGTVMASGSATVTFAFGPNLSLLPTGTYALLGYGGTQLGDVTPFWWSGTKGGRQDVDIVNGTQSIDLVIGNAFPIWSGTFGSGWSTTDNWVLNTDDAPTSFITTDTVVFNDAGDVGSVDITENVAPATTTFSGNSLAYTLSSTGGFGITSGNLVKSGAASVTVATTNSFGGGTIVSGGTLAVTAAGGLGSGGVTVDGGVLALSGVGTVGSGTITLTSGTILAATAGALGSGPVTVASGVLDATAASAVTSGPVTLAAGTIRVGGDGALGTNTLSLNGGVLSSDSATGRSLSNPVSVGGDVTLGNASNTGPLALSGAVSLGGVSRQLTTPSNVTLSGAVTNGGLTKAGAGTLTLSGSNSYAAGTTVTAGTIALGNNAALGTGLVTLSGGGLDLAGRSIANGVVLAGGAIAGNGGTITGVVSETGGARSLTVPSNLRLDGVNTFTGATAITSGTLEIGGAGQLNAGSYSAAISNAGTLFVNSSAAQTLGGVISGAGGLRKGGAGTLSLNQTNTYTGNTVIDGGVLSLTGGGGAVGTIRGTVTVNAGATLRLAANDVTGYNTDGTRISTINLVGGTMNVATTGGSGQNQTLGSTAIIMTGGAFTGVAGSNVDFFGGASRLDTLASPTTSVVSVANVSIRQTGGLTFTVAAGTTPSGIDLDVSSVVSNNGSFSTQPLVKSGLGRMRLTGSNTYGASTTINAGTLEVGGSGVLGGGSYAGAISNAGAFVVSTSANQTLSGAISGTGSLSKSGGGTLTLSNAGNSYSGGSTLGGGTVVFASGGLGSTGGIAFSAGTLRWATGNTQDVSSRLSLGTGNLTFDTNGNNVDFAVPIGGAGGTKLTKTGGGRLTLTGTSTYGDGTELLGGTLSVTSLAGIGTGYLAAKNGSTFAYTGSGTETTTRNLFLDNGAATFDITSAAAAHTWNDAALKNQSFTKTGPGALTIGGAFSGAASVRADGGRLTLTAANTFSGVIAVNSGTLALPGSVNGGGAVTVNNGGTLDLRTGTGLFKTGGFFGAQDTTYVTVNSGGVLDTDKFNYGANNNFNELRNNYYAMLLDGGTLRFSGSNEFLRAFTVGASGATVEAVAGATVIKSAGDTASGNIIRFSADSTLTFTGGGNITIGDSLAPAGYGSTGFSIAKTGTGRLVLGGANGYTGTTTVDAGTLVVNGSLANSALAVAAGATLMGSGTIAGQTTILGLHAPGNSPAVQTLADVTYGTGASVEWELWGSTESNSPLAYDQIVVTGSLAFTGPTTLNLVFTGSASVSSLSSVAWSDSFWDESREWLLYDVTGATTEFDNLTLATTDWLDSTGASFDTVRGGSTFGLENRSGDLYIVYAAVPEPGMLALAAIGLAAAGWAARRRFGPDRRAREAAA